MASAAGEPPLYRKFLQGGLAAMAGASASHPLDLIKAVYSSVRFGVYDVAKERLGRNQPAGTDLPLLEKVVAGLGAGAVGAAVANPCDVIMVRMQADGKLPPELRRNYRNVFHGLGSITREEGVGALWRGCAPTVVRAMIVTASQFAAYDQIKEYMIARGASDNPATHISAGFCAGFVASCTSTPVDTIKTRLMNSNPGQYKGPVDCLLQTVRNEGPMAVYKGFVPTFVRQAPYLVVMFVTLEQLKGFFRWVDSRSEPPAARN